ncbi:10210_t:CDS:2 [Paraglomus brasilianum]|uniref:10210_t:CDS:1 n=1 Tax=Paraglomus brasilianum TaxID=144538 RepID=A0A9N8VMN2_9GLOM|nr:10210_t:CDS:2 [Paraglomus brasilianum]
MQARDSHSIFNCQRCKQPLRIDDSLNDLSKANVDLLLSTLPEDNSHYRDSRLPHFSEHPSSMSHKTSKLHPSRPIQQFPNKESYLGPSESYVVLSRSQIAPLSQPSLPLSSSDATSTDQRTSLSYRLKVTSRLLDIMSQRSEITHPICVECTDMLLDSLSKQLSDASKEKECYVDFLKKINSSLISDEEGENLKKEIKEIKVREAAAIETITNIEHERDSLKKELEALEAEARELDKMEERYWQEFNDFHIQLSAFQNERDSVNLKYDHDTRQLEKLQKTNVYNDTFYIVNEGHFGTINGFRLGYLPTQRVEWNEINAAWGQTVLLLSTIANKLNFTFKTYRLIPLGSFSKIEKIEGDRAVYELYGSGDYAISRVFQNGRFDTAMVAFLNCLQQLGEYAEKQDRNIKLPYRINKDKIGDVSIKRHIGHDEQWTRALKYTLHDTKWILAFAASVSHTNYKRRLE